MKQRVELDETLLSDLHKIIGASPLLYEAYEGLPSQAREHVDDAFLNLIWDTILTNASAYDMSGNPSRSTLGAILEAARIRSKKR